MRAVGRAWWQPLAVLLLLAVGSLGMAGVHVDTANHVLVDSSGRMRLFHGTNFVQKSAPYYPTITDTDIALMGRLGLNVVRLGVMVDGLFPSGPAPSAPYLAVVRGLADRLWAANISTIVDLHQDVLAARVCGEGLPNWAVNVSTLGCLPFPEPLSFNGSIVVEPDAATGGWMPPGPACAPVGLLKAIGWSELYLTDASGKAFGQMYAEASSTLHDLFGTYWRTVAAAFRGHPGVLAYEILNEPWVGDHVAHPELLLLGGEAERRDLGRFMQRMHAAIRAEDNATMVLYAPAEINNRLMRPVGYEAGFLPGEPMAFHTYCVTGTDASGPTSPFTKELCHVNDGLQLGNRAKDLRRLGTAGFVTEFGGVSDSDTGRAEVEFVTDHLDAQSPPLSWAFWDGLPSGPLLQKVLARTYPRATAGTVTSLSFTANGEFRMEFAPSAAPGTTEVVLSRALYYPDGIRVEVGPAGCCEVAETGYGLALRVTNATAGFISLYIGAR